MINSLIIVIIGGLVYFSSKTVFNCGILNNKLDINTCNNCNRCRYCKK